jgi:hypothetical protein
MFSRLSRAVAAVDRNLCPNYSLDHKTERAKLLSQLDVLHTQTRKVRVPKGSPPCKGFKSTFKKKNLY